MARLTTVGRFTGSRRPSRKMERRRPLASPRLELTTPWLVGGPQKRSVSPTPWLIAGAAICPAFTASSGRKKEAYRLAEPKGSETKARIAAPALASPLPPCDPKVVTGAIAPRPLDRLKKTSTFYQPLMRVPLAAPFSPLISRPTVPINARRSSSSRAPIGASNGPLFTLKRRNASSKVPITRLLPPAPCLQMGVVGPSVDSPRDER